MSLLLAIAFGASAVAQDPSPSPSPGAEPGAPQDAVSSPGRVAFVPVRRFWSAERDISLDDVRAAIEGRHDDVKRVLVASDDPAALWFALGVTPAGTTRAVPRVAQVKRAVDQSRHTLGLVPAAAVRPDLRALSVDGRSLFGAGRVTDLDEWPLVTPAGPADKVFTPQRTWTLVAGGDVMLDREPYRQSVIEGKGPDYPWDGGFAKIRSRTCCTENGGPAIIAKRAGSRGAVRNLLSAADIAVVNHEAPAPNVHTYHPGGLVFTVDPDLLKGLAKAGIDAVSLANNHIRNAGSQGVTQTVRNLRRAGVRSFGAGADEARARRPACFEPGEQRVCLLGYDAINTAVHAVTDTRAGAAELVAADVKADIQALRRAGADVIVVWPHWGTEYVTSIRTEQRRQARDMVRAGADLVLGAHSHVVGPVEFIDGAPVLYSMGDLTFDLPRFEATEEAVLVELTFHGSRLAQMELHPTVIVDRAQLNLLDREADGKVVMKRMRDASKVLE